MMAHAAAPLALRRGHRSGATRQGGDMAQPIWIDEDYKPPQQAHLECSHCGWSDKHVLVTEMPDNCPLCGEELDIERAF